MQPIQIDDSDDPRLAPFRDVRERDLVGRQGRFVAEGKVVLRVLFQARRFTPESVLILDARLSGMADTLALAPPDMPVYVATRQVMDAVAGFHIHRGILAIGRRREDQNAAALLAMLPAQATVLALVGISNHDNVGAIFRNMAAFGGDAVLLDATTCDPLYRKAIRVSVGAALKVPFASGGSASEQARALAEAGFTLFALSPTGSEDIASIDWPARSALFLGSEGDGLPEDLMAGMRMVRIPIVEDFDSLNVATAAAIALHRLRRSA